MDALLDFAKSLDGAISSDHKKKQVGMYITDSRDNTFEEINGS